MKYHIEGTYYSKNDNTMIMAWKDHFNKGPENFSFRDWLKKETGCDHIYGDFEEGWRLYWEDETKYIWFLLKHGVK